MSEQHQERVGNTSLAILSREPDREPVFLLMATGQIESGEVSPARTDSRSESRFEILSV